MAGQVSLLLAGRPPQPTAHRKVVIRPFRAGPLELPIAVPEVTYTGIGPRVAVIARPDMDPLTIIAGRKLPKATLEVAVMGGDTQRTVEGDVELLVNLAAPHLQPLVISYGRLFGSSFLTRSGHWVVENCDVKAGETRVQGSNEASRAVVTFDLLEANMVWFAGLANLARNAAPPPPSPAPAGGRSHVVKAGERLWDIAVTYCGDGTKWTRIADANGIRRPELLQVGARLIIP